jgi:hypothetical protein
MRHFLLAVNRTDLLNDINHLSYSASIAYLIQGIDRRRQPTMHAEHLVINHR